MKYHKRSAALIVKSGKILLMHRVKNGHKYYAIPGGTIEKNETPEQTVIREIKEETNLDIALDELIWEYDDGFAYCYYFLAKNITGIAKLGGPEADKNSKNNFYKLEWVDIDELQNILLYPVEIAKKISKEFNN